MPEGESLPDDLTMYPELALLFKEVMEPEPEEPAGPRQGRPAKRSRKKVAMVS